MYVKNNISIEQLTVDSPAILICFLRLVNDLYLTFIYTQLCVNLFSVGTVQKLYKKKEVKIHIRKKKRNRNYCNVFFVG